jgi:hypothetical protein
MKKVVFKRIETPHSDTNHSRALEQARKKYAEVALARAENLHRDSRVNYSDMLESARLVAARERRFESDN